MQVRNATAAEHHSRIVRRISAINPNEREKGARRKQ
jgi:hypothetical protein